MTGAASDQSVSTDLASLEAELVSAEGDASLIASVDDHIKLRRASAEDKVRSRVTLWVVGLFIAQAAVAVLTAAFSPDHLDDVIMVITVTMPVLTLVLGYYFGSSSR